MLSKLALDPIMLSKVALDPVMLYKLDNHSLNLCRFDLQNMAKVHNQLLLPSFYSNFLSNFMLISV
jgi:hypothetical protein